MEADTEVFDDPTMPQACQDAGLTQESLDSLGRHIRCGQDCLYGGFAAAGAMKSMINHSHATAGELAGELEVGDLPGK